MPLYEYECKTCRHEFETLVRNGESPRCPECGGERLEKLLSVPAAHTAGGRADLPVCGPMPQGDCGLPQCGMGGCQGLGM